MSKCLIGNISKEIMNQFKMQYSFLTDEDMNMKMKDLVDKSNLNESKLSIDTSFVYMFDFNEEEMNQITNFMKKHQVYPIYAASTSTNLLWTLEDLLCELNKEHQMFQTMRELKMLIQKTLMLPKNKNQKEVEEMMMEAFVAFQEKKMDSMKEMIVKLKGLLENYEES